MNAPFPLSGATRVIAIVGDPIAQVKSPAGVTASLQALGRNAVVVPAHVAPGDLADYVRGMGRARNVDGLIITVPHKFAAFDLCGTVTERARFLGAVNTLRRNVDGSWHGDMCDGIGFVRAIQREGCVLDGARVLLVGAGGAGCAIGQAMLEAGAAELAVHDADVSRRDALVGRLGARARVGSDDPSGFDVVVNASWCGMRADDPWPVQVQRLAVDMFVGDVITAPAVTPLVQAARDLGCRTQVGGGMFAAVCELMVEFLVAEGPLA
ncbi:shikimate dehydrogenase [Sphaerotilus sp.]|uniref:shikimate dehydrogenase family protein n=1 Tax=Sphaerotilus sp. TaxID=2093942 RepID=UPI0034E2E9A7